MKRKKGCMKSVQIRSFFWSVFSPNLEKYGPEKTPYLDTFLAVKFQASKFPDEFTKHDSLYT